MHPNLFAIGPLTFHSYGLMVAIGILAASKVLTHYAPRVNRTSDQMIDFIFVMVISGFLCARLLYVVYEFNYFKEKPLEIFAIWNGGIIFYGGLLGALLAFLIYAKVNKVPLLPLLDLGILGTCLAQAFGRVGCFLNGCCYGKETTCFLGVKFPFANAPLHPAQLYEAAYLFVVFIFLKLFYDKNYQAAGQTALVYFVLQPIGRFAIEYFRNDMPLLALGLTLGQWMSLLIVASAVTVTAIRSAKHGSR